MGKCVILHNVSAKDVKEVLVRFPYRYHNYYSSIFGGRWKCGLVKQQDNCVWLQLVDLLYEPPRGEKFLPESPVFHLSVGQEGQNVVLNYRHEWQKKILFWVYFFAAVTMSSLLFGLYLLCFAADIAPACVMLGCFAFLLVVGVCWIKKSRRHDRLTIKVFEELLSKNFQVDDTYE